MKNVKDLIKRLSELHTRTRETPLFNPVFQLGLDISRELEAARISLTDIEAIVAELECESKVFMSLRQLAILLINS